MPTPSVFNGFPEGIAEKQHNLATDTLKVALTNTAPSAANTTISDITQISSAGGYAAATIATSDSSQSGGVYSLTLGSVSFTASGADFDEFRYVVLYNDTSAGDQLICWFDRGVGYVLADGDTYTINSSVWLTNA